MVDRIPILGSSMIPRKGTAALQPVEPADEQNNDAGASSVTVASLAPSSPTPAPAGGRAPLAPAERKPDRRALSYRPTVKDHDWLQEYSYRSGYSIQFLLDEALRRFREDHGG
jgi:hypothetical protein